MAMRKIVRIDEEKCDGCGVCIPACAEGAIQLVDGVAKLVADVYCDGLGACLGECPRGAITIEEREAAPFDEEEANARVARLKQRAQPDLACGCPGSAAKQLDKAAGTGDAHGDSTTPSELVNWPVQLRLAHSTAPWLQNADVLLVADCVPFAYADFHKKFLRGKPVLVGCPKLDDADYYVEKLAQMLTTANIQSLTVVHMEVPCCTGLVRIAEAALKQSGRDIPFSDMTISIAGEVLSETSKLKDAAN